MEIPQLPGGAIRAMSIRARLAILILVTAVPLISFAIGLVLWHSKTEQDSLRQHAAGAAVAAMQAVDRELAGAISALQVLAASPSLAAGDFRAFHAQAKSAVGIGGNSVIVLYDAQGNRVVSTAARYGEPLPARSDMTPLARPFYTGKPHISSLIMSFAVGHPTLAVVVPVFVEGRVPYVLAVGLLSSRLSEAVVSSGLPHEWFASVVDQEGTIIARTRAADRFIGTKEHAEAWGRIQAQPGASGYVDGDTKEGDPAMLAFARSSQAGWTTVIAIPTQALTDQLHRSLSLVATAAVAVLLLAAALGWWGLEQITRPLERLEHLAQSLEGGEDAQAGPTGIEQFDRLGGTIARAGRVIRERHRELREQQEQKDQFIATLAHELRNPLAPIRTGLHILSRHPPPSVAERTVATMQRQLSHMVRLIDDLLDVSRVARGTLVLRKEEADLKAIVADAVASAETYINGAGQHLVVEVPPEPVCATVDSARACQVLINLLHNASKFTPSGGLIRLRLECTPDTAEISVSDSGCGIAAADLENIFELFYQVRDETDAAPPGLGIGLSLSRRLAQMHGGELRAESKGRGHGATFTLRLPRLAASHAHSAVPVHRTDGVSAGRRIMVVEDNLDAADTLAAALRLEGHTVCIAHDGPSAIKLASEVRVDVVLLDIGMPMMDGYEVCRQLRGMEGYRDALIVALTGWGAARDRQRAEEAGFDAHVTKPADWPQIEEALSAREGVLSGAAS